jgi:lipopolysaccharide/colanic/teichoic acid biosynthesis glycosyltransferase/glycosyltransferase involved in cell wall biosynthesis
VRILYVVQHFSGPNGTSSVRAYEAATRLVRLGHSVTVLCGTFEAATATDFDTAVAAGVEIVRSPIAYGQAQTTTRRLLTFHRYMRWALRQGKRLPRPDVVFASSTPLTIGDIGRILARHHRVPLVFEVRDLWPEVPIALGALRNPVLQWLANRMAQRVYDASDHIVALSPGMKTGILRWGVPGNRVSIVTNCSTPRVVCQPGERERMRRHMAWTGRFVVVHPGAIGQVNNVDYLVDCGHELRRIGARDVLIAIVGAGAMRDHIARRIDQEGVENVRLYPPVPHQQIPQLLSAADAGVVTVLPVSPLETNSANKFFDLLAAGLPVALNYGGWQAEVLHESGAGGSCSGTDPGALARLLADWQSNPRHVQAMGTAARNLAEARFDRERLVIQLERILRQTVQDRSSTAEASDRVPAAVSATANIPPGGSAATVYTAGGKRLLDIVLSASALTVLTPVLALLAVAVRLRLGAPVLFRQQRPGLNGAPFDCLKFRTMSDARDADGRLLADAQRLTSFGRFLRETSLDELPQLLNVLKGDMSLVGPRPLLTDYLKRYTPEQARRHETRPGLTGLAQVSGRNGLSWEDRFALDVRYVDSASFWLDIRILASTVRAVTARRGISQPGHATAQEFMGSPQS